MRSWMWVTVTGWVTAVLLMGTLAACQGEGSGESRTAPASNEAASNAAASAAADAAPRAASSLPAFNPTRVAVLPLEARDFTLYTTYIGHLLPNERVTLRSEMEGAVERAAIQVGQQVQADKVLVNISTSQLKVRRDLARSNLDLATAAYERNLQLAEKQLIPAAQLDVSQNEREVASYNLRLAELELEKSQVRSPINGMVKEKQVQTGAFVSKGQALAEILDLSRVLALIHVPEKDLRHIQPGKKVSISLDALPGRTFSGKVKTTGIEADSQNRSFPIEIELPNPKRELLPGMLSRVTVETGIYRQQLLIPRQAVLEREVGGIAYLAEDGRAIERTIETGVSRNGEVHVISGLAPGDVLIVSGQHQLGPGSPIEVVQSETPQAAAPAKDPAESPAR